MVRPRGWHLEEKHVLVEGQPISGGLFDFGLFFFHNARALMAKGSGPYFYLPKLESHLEARLWNDVFHFAHAAILHWSPTFRALIKHKRKDDPKVDEAQDGGRAIVVEEGLTAWIFARAKELKFFEGQTTVSFDLLKTVQQFVAGYEVDACPLSLWEIAILEGYDVFRQVKKNNGGIIVADRSARTVRYKPLTGDEA